MASTIKIAQTTNADTKAESTSVSKPDLRIKPKEQSDSSTVDAIAKDSIDSEIKMLTTRITIKPGAEPLCRRAYFYGLQGRNDLAIKDLERAVKLFLIQKMPSECLPKII